MCLCMSERLGGFCSESVFKHSFVIGQCQVNMNILAPKIRSLQEGDETRNSIFSKKALMIRLHFSNLWRSLSYMKMYRWYLEDSDSTRSRGPNVYATRTCMSQLVQSATNNCPPSDIHLGWLVKARKISRRLKWAGQQLVCESWGSLGGDYEEYSLLGLDVALSDRRLPAFRRKILPPSSGL
jgi:hypothetical protein